MLANKCSVDLKVGDQGMILGHFPSVPVYNKNKLHLSIASWYCLLYTSVCSIHVLKKNEE